VGIDRPDDPDDPDVPPDRPADDRDDQGGGGFGGGVRCGEKALATERAAAEKWDETAKESRWMWSEYERRWPPEEHAPVDRSDDPPAPGAEMATGPWTAPSTAGLNQRATGLPNGSRKGSRPRCARWKARIQAGTWLASSPFHPTTRRNGVSSRFGYL
jgi:hypothetical protein